MKEAELKILNNGIDLIVKELFDLLSEIEKQSEKIDKMIAKLMDIKAHYLKYP